MAFVRKAETKEDITLIAPLFLEYLHSEYGNVAKLEDATNFLVTRFQNKESIILIAVSSATLTETTPTSFKMKAVGFTQIYSSFSSITLSQSLSIHDLYVVPQVRRHGIATKLLLAAKQLATSNGSQQIGFLLRKRNVAAETLFQKLGFHIQGQSLEYELRINESEKKSESNQTPLTLNSSKLTHINSETSNSIAKTETKVVALLDHPEYIPRVAEWLYNEWKSEYHAFNIIGLEGMKKDLKETYVNRDKVNTMFIGTVDENGSTVPVASVGYEMKDIVEGPYEAVGPWLTCLYTVPSYRRGGIATTLVKTVLSTAKKNGKWIWLWTETKSVEWYKKQFQFKFIDNYHCKSTGKINVIMRKDFDVDGC